MKIVPSLCKKSSVFFKLNPEEQALFFDIDGTLLDIAARPDQVIVPKDLTALLSLLVKKFSGAIALISGRSIENIKTLFSPPCAIAGLHGGEIFLNKNYKRFFPKEGLFLTVKKSLYEEVNNDPRFSLEEKDPLLALHYHNPNAKPKAESLMLKALAECGASYELQYGKNVIELKPAGFHKGTALNFFMEQATFKGRLPIAFGDDLTDQFMFDEAHRQKGWAVYIGKEKLSKKHFPHADYKLDKPASLHAFLSNGQLCQD